MDIEKKIDEIRKKPEHIRLRYVWVCVAVSMVFILTIWFLSIGLGFHFRKGPILEDDPFKEYQAQKEELNQYRDQLDSIQQQLNSAGGYRDDSELPE